GLARAQRANAVDHEAVLGLHAFELHRAGEGIEEVAPELHDLVDAAAYGRPREVAGVVPFGVGMKVAPDGIPVTCADRLEGQTRDLFGGGRLSLGHRARSISAAVRGDRP